MKATPLVSIIVPVFKVEEYLDRCIISLINQTLKDIEIILVDDGSPDNCPVMCDDWATKDSRIKVIHKHNEGLGFARNSGLEIACGEFIAFVDSDDYVDLDMYKVLYTKALENRSDIVYCGHKYERLPGEFQDLRDFDKETTFTKEQMIDLSIRYFDSRERSNLTMSVWHSIYSKMCISNLKFYSEREVRSEDLPFQIRAIQSADKILYTPDVLYYYCYNEKSLTRTFGFDDFLRYVRITSIISEYYQSDLKHHTYSFFLKSTCEFLRTMMVKPIPIHKKLQYLRDIVDVPIWKEVKNHKHMLDMNRQSIIYYQLILAKKIKLLYAFSSFDVFVICNKLGLKDNIH